MATAPKATVASVATKVFEELSKLEGDDRKRALNGALAMLGEPALAPHSGKGDGKSQSQEDSGASAGEFNAKAKLWMKAHSVTSGELSHVFHTEAGTVELIAATVPGNTKSKQTINAYLLTGIKSLLETGEAKFGDKAARNACQKFGCFDRPNHAKFIKTGKSNYLGGNKASDWTLTGPGQKAAADLIKQMQSA